MRAPLTVALVGGFGVFALPGVACAAADDAAAAPPATVDAQEIVVTAQRRSESGVNVPVSIFAASAENLNKAGVGDMHSLATVVPSLHIDSSGAFFQPSLRGVGTAIAGAGASANVATYVDGIYKPNALSNDMDFLDIASIQVLKGPQGTLFGRNSTGGAILVTTRDPSFDTRLEGRLTYGSFNTASGALFATTGLVPDKLAASVSLHGTRSDGWVYNTVTGTNVNPVRDYGGHAKLAWTPSSDWKVMLGVELNHVDDASAYAASAYNNWSDSALFGTANPSVNTPRQVSLSGPVEHKFDTFSTTLKVTGDLGFAKITSYTSYEHTRGDEATNELAAPFPAIGAVLVPPATQATIPYIVTNADWHYTDTTITQEIDLSNSHSGNVDWVTGLFYYYDKTNFAPFNLGLFGPFGPGGLDVPTGDVHYSSFETPTYSGAIFADVTYNAGPWHFTLGGRGSIDRIKETFQAFFPTVGPVLHGDHKFTSFTPRFVARYSLSPNANVYLSYSEGTKAGLFNSSGFSGQPDPLAPERLRDLEGGFKMAMNGWHVEASAFHYWYKNQQVSTYDGGVSFFENAPASRIYGGDLSIRGPLTPFADLNMAAAAQHAHYVDFTNAALQTFNTTYGVFNNSTNVSGGVMERQSPFSGDVSLDLHNPVMGGRADLVATVAYQSKSSFDFADTLVNPARTLVNMRVSWSDPSSRFTIAGNAANLTNKIYPIQILPNGGGFGVVYGKPRSFNVELTVKY